MSIGNSSHDAPPSDRNESTPEPPDLQAPLSTLPTIGHILATARRDAALSLEAVSAATRVRVPIVRAIESDDFTRCGGEVYARGHLRALAQAVHLDPRPLVARFDAEHGGRPKPTPAAPLYEAERLRPEPRRPNWTAAMIAAIVVVVGFVGFTLLSGGSDSGGSRPVAGHASQPRLAARTSPSGNPSGTPDPAASASSAASPPSDGALAAVPGDMVVVKLTAGQGRSWISATASDGHVLYQGLLENGQSRTFTDPRKISLIIGNAGAVDMFVNGKDLGTAGPQGRLVRTQFTPGDPQQG